MNEITVFAPATVANVSTLRERVIDVIEPASGRLTGADSGAGRLPDPQEIALLGDLLLDRPDALTALVCVNGWLTLSAHTRRCFLVRERLLHAGGAQAWVEAQPLFLYPAEWMASRLPRLEAEDALAISHFQGKENLLKRLNALKQADFSRRAAAITCPTLIISAADDLLVPASCSRVLQAAIPGSQLAEMAWGGHACNVTDTATFNPILCNGLAAMLPAPQENL